MGSCIPDVSMGFLRPTLNNGELLGAYSSDNMIVPETHISIETTFGKQQFLGINQNQCSAILDNGQGKETTILGNKSHSENQPGQAILDAFKSNRMENIYNRNNRINGEVNNMFSSCDFQISQGLAESLENTSVGGTASNIELTTTATQIIPTLPSSDKNPITNGESSIPKSSKKRSLEQEIVPEETTARNPPVGNAQRTSNYRGVTKHRWTGRYEAHLWDNSEKRAGQCRKGRQVYLGGYDCEEKAARAYDLASLKFWGCSTITNFPITEYVRELEEMKFKSKYEYITMLRRRSSGFSRGASVYRGVTRHHQNGRWQARIGRVAGNKDLYLGTYATQEEAAEAYDIATIKYRGQNAVTNFDINRYDVQKILNNPLPIGGLAKRMKMEEKSGEITVDDPQVEDESTLSSKGDSTISGNAATALTASIERHGIYQQLENPWMTSYQEREQLPVQANDTHILNFPTQLQAASYEQYLQMQSMLTGQLQYNLMSFNSGNNALPSSVIYRDMSINSAANGLPLDCSYVPSSTLSSATSNSYAHHFNDTWNETFGLKTEGPENMYEKFSYLTGPGY